MTYLRKLAHFTLFMLFTFFQLSEAVASTADGNFTFTLSADAARTSAGVYKFDGTDDILIRTLWSGVPYTAGPHTAYWDAKDDADMPVPANGKYKLKILSNSVTYHWEGVIGNTSAKKTGGTVFDQSGISDAIVVGDFVYTAHGYSEGKPAQRKFLLSNPTGKLAIGDGLVSTGQSTGVLATDGTNVYYGGSDPFYNGWKKPDGSIFIGNDPHDGSLKVSRSFIFATKVSDESQVIFSAGTNPLQVFGEPNHYDSAIDVVLSVEKLSGITGIAAQATGDFLFVGRNGDNTVDVLNKNTGALIHANCGIVNPAKMYADDAYLYLIQGDGYSNALNRFAINHDGTLSPSPLALSGAALSNPVAVTVSRAGDLVIVDAGASSQIKFFNKSNGSFLKAFGQAGGYVNTPMVANDRFMFKDGKAAGGGGWGAVSFAPDGSFIVFDPGNMRIQHFAATGTYINNMMLIGYNYSAQVDSNDPTRVFSNYLEFKIDYSKPLSPTNGSWVLYRNWAQNMTAEHEFGSCDARRLKDVTTFAKNGRTYAFANNSQATGKLEMIELAETGIRYTGFVPKVTADVNIDPDGSLITCDLTGAPPGYTQVFLKRPLLGFDANNNPQYVDEAHAGNVFASTAPALGTTDPIKLSEMKPRQSTTSGIRITWNPDATSGYHLGGLKGDKWLWKTSASTFAGYRGNFPSDGTFDSRSEIGGKAGASMQTVGKNIFWNYVGEFWGAYSAPGAGETNEWNHYYDDGLFVGNFGTPGFHWEPNMAAMAGNSFGTGVVQVGGDIYIYHSDESVHGGVHRWKVSNLNSIQEQAIAIAVPTKPVPPALPYVDLMAGLPFDTVLKNGTYAGWTIAGLDHEDATRVKTSHRTYNRKNGDDINVAFGPQGSSISRTLGNNTGLTKWSVSGQVQLLGIPNPHPNEGVYIDVVDKDDKVIGEFSWWTDLVGGGWYMFNDHKFGIITNHDISFVKTTQNEQPLTYSFANKTLTMSYADFPPIAVTAPYESGANMANPSKFIVRYKNIVFGQGLNLKLFRFSPNLTGSNDGTRR